MPKRTRSIPRGVTRISARSCEVRVRSAGSASARANDRGQRADEEELVRIDAPGDESAAQAPAAMTGVRAIHEAAVFVRESSDELTRTASAGLEIRDVDFENGRSGVLVHVVERRKQVRDAMRAIETEQHRQPAAAFHFFDEHERAWAESARRKGLVATPREVGGQRFEGPALPLEGTRLTCEQVTDRHPQQRHAAWFSGVRAILGGCSQDALSGALGVGRVPEHAESEALDLVRHGGQSTMSRSGSGPRRIGRELFQVVEEGESVDQGMIRFGVRSRALNCYAA